MFSGLVLVPAERVSLLCTLYLPEGFFHRQAFNLFERVGVVDDQRAVIIQILTRA